MQWERNNSYLIGNYKMSLNDIEQDSHLAIFDIDWTIIKTKSGNVRPKDNKDWMFLYPNVKYELRKFIKNNYYVIFYTNQKNLNKTDGKMKLWMTKIDNIAKKLNIKFVIFASMMDDECRKPKIGFFKRTGLLDKMNKLISFYCGDAAGRTARKYMGVYHKKDFADTDYKFAKNLGIRFYTPEGLFDIKNDKKYWSITYPLCLNEKKVGKYKKFKPKKDLEMVIMVGFPGSGKSYYTNKYILKHGYVVINMDTLKTQKKCLKICEEEIKNNNSVVIDNTNMGTKSRKMYIDIGKKYNMYIRCIEFKTCRELSRHNAYFRSSITDKKPIPNLVYNIMTKKYEKPRKKEGFDKIKRIDFIFEDKKLIDNYYRYYF